VPFVALTQGRAGRPSLRRLLLRAVVPGLAVYLIALFLHEHIIGFTALP
jgi:hypothetical protein